MLELSFPRTFGLEQDSRQLHVMPYHVKINIDAHNNEKTIYNKQVHIYICVYPEVDNDSIYLVIIQRYKFHQTTSLKQVHVTTNDKLGVPYHTLQKIRRNATQWT